MALFQTIDEIQEFIPVSNNFDAEALAPFIDRAISAYIAPCISAAQVKASTEDYVDIQDPAFLRILKRAVVTFAFLDNLPFAAVTIDASGIQRASTQNQKPASPEDIERIRLKCLQIGWDSVEQLLHIMETNPADTKYTFWRTSPEYTLANELFLVSAADFNRYADIGARRRVFARIRPSIKMVEENDLIPLLTESFAASVRANRNTTPNRVLLDKYIKPAVACLALADALPGLALAFGYDSILTFDNTGANYAKGRKTADRELLDAWAEKLQKRGAEALAKILPFLAEYPDDYPGSPQSSQAVRPRVDRSKFEHRTFF